MVKEIVKMLTYVYAKNIILKTHSDSKIVGSYKIPTGYVFSLKPKNWKKDEYVLDGFFKVSNETGKISEYSPIMNPDEFKEMFNNKIE